MVPPQAGFAAASQTITTINTIFGWLKSVEQIAHDYKELHSVLSDLERSVKTQSVEFDRWRRFWAINKPDDSREPDYSNNEEYFSLLWGPPIEIQDILDHCTRISEGFIRITTELEKYHSGSPTRSQDQSRSGLSSHLAPKSKTDPDEDVARLKRLDFILRKKVRTNDSFNDLKKRIEELDRTSKAAFKTKWGDVMAKKVSDFGIQTLEGDLALLLIRLIGHRPVSRKLHSSYVNALENIPRPHGESGFIRLGIDVFGERTTCNELYKVICDSQTRYQLIFGQVLSPSELSVEGPVELNPDSQDHPKSSFYSAYSALKTGELKALFKVSDHSLEGPQIDANDSWYFRLSHPLKNELYSPESNALRVEVTRLLYEIIDDDSRDFKIPERINLAFAVVKCGLLLSGTPWLNGFKSANIERGRKDDAGTYRYTIKASALHTKEISTTSENEFRHIKRDIVAIGKFLIAVVLGKEVVGVEKSERRQFKLRKLGEGEEAAPIMLHTMEDITSSLKAVLGDNYAAAVEYCFSDSTTEQKAHRRSNTHDGRMNALRAMMTGYYEKVYEPLWDLKIKLNDDYDDTLAF